MGNGGTFYSAAARQETLRQGFQTPWPGAGSVEKEPGGARSRHSSLITRATLGARQRERGRTRRCLGIGVVPEDLGVVAREVIADPCKRQV